MTLDSARRPGVPWKPMASWRRHLPVLVTSLVAGVVLVALSGHEFTWGRAVVFGLLYAMALAAWETLDRRRETRRLR